MLARDEGGIGVSKEKGGKETTTLEPSPLDLIPARDTSRFESTRHRIDDNFVHGGAALDFRISNSFDSCKTLQMGSTFGKWPRFVVAGRQGRPLLGLCFGPRIWEGPGRKDELRKQRGNGKEKKKAAKSETDDLELDGCHEGWLDATRLMCTL